MEVWGIVWMGYGVSSESFVTSQIWDAALSKGIGLHITRTRIYSYRTTITHILLVMYLHILGLKWPTHETKDLWQSSNSQFRQYFVLFGGIIFVKKPLFEQKQSNSYHKCPFFFLNMNNSDDSSDNNSDDDQQPRLSKRSFNIAINGPMQKTNLF